MKPGLLYLNFGGPTCDEELEPFLYELLSDVLPGPSWVSRFAAARLAPLRAKKVREQYRSIGWSPLVQDSRRQAEAAVARLDPAPPWALGMMFTEPTIRHGIERLLAQGVDHLVAVGLFPHYSFATSASAYDMVHRALAELRRTDVAVHYARTFYGDAAYLEAVAATIRQTAAELSGEGPIHLLFSAHGIPLSFVRRGDPYPEQVRTSVQGVLETLGWTDPWDLAWQSRLGPVKWLTPTTPQTLEHLGSEGCRRLLAVPISFVGEHIETLDEIDREYAHLARSVGIEHFGRAPAVGMQPAFIRCLADLSADAIARFDRYVCVRCLEPKPASHRRRVTCPDCAFVTPQYLREG